MIPDSSASKVSLKIIVKKPITRQVKLVNPIKIPSCDSDDEDLLQFPLHDLRKDIGALSGTDKLNNDITEMLNSLIAITLAIKASSTGKDKANHSRRINSFQRAKDGIAAYDKRITSGAQAKKEIDGVGAGIAKRIDEFLKTGTLQELEQYVTDEMRTIIELIKVTGIGEVKAKSLMTDFNVTSVNDLITKYRSGIVCVAKNQLTHHIAVGLDYYHDIEQRMPWSEADAITKRVINSIKELNHNLVVNVCGSYRRHSLTCGDIDVLISHPLINDESQIKDELTKIINKLESTGLLVGHLTSMGHTKYMGICKLNIKSIGRRIDIRFVTYSSLGAATLYFTGSGKFNKIMRYHANQRGYTLNEYGLYQYVNQIKGERIFAPTERDIFDVLRLVYLSPTEREF